MENNTHWLAEKFNIQREIIEAAETPFSKLAMFVLPIISPLVPATMTGMHLYQIFLDVFQFDSAWLLSGILAFVAGFVLELLGYVGAITFIKGIFNFLSTRRDEYLVPMVLNGSSYIFYLILLWMINYQLGKYLGIDATLNNIIAALSFVTVPTSLLAGSHLSEKAKDERDAEKSKIVRDNYKAELERQDALRREENERQDRLRLEKEQMRLERWRLKNGYAYQATTQSSEFQNSFGTKEKTGRPSEWETPVFDFMDNYYRNSQQAATFSEVLDNVKIGEQPISKAQASKLRNRWIGEKRWERVKLDSESNGH